MESKLGVVTQNYVTVLFVLKRITTNTSHPLNALQPRISKACPYSLTVDKRDIHSFRDRRNRNLKRTEDFLCLNTFLK